MIDAFERVTTEDLANRIQRNISAYRDEFSPYCDLDRAPTNVDETIWVDANYGLLYGSWVADARGVYGSTPLLPNDPLDERADRGYLRVPFARIPRITVHTLDDVETVIAEVRKDAPQGSHVLFRAQTREYLLGRSPRTLSALYGDAAALEPSLSNSAARSKVDMTNLLPSWAGFLNFVLDVIPQFGGERPNVTTLQAWRTNYQFSRFALAMAQHYGLPSTGLDVTDDPTIALFFGHFVFDRSSKQPNTVRYIQKSDWTSPSVLYVFNVPTSDHSLRFHGSVPRGLISDCRPQRQRAHFLHSGWGCARNECARWMAAALYFDKPLEFDGHSPRHLFPNSEEDPFVAALNVFKIRSDMLPRDLAEYLSFYDELEI